MKLRRTNLERRGPLRTEEHAAEQAIEQFQENKRSLYRYGLDRLLAYALAISEEIAGPHTYRHPVVDQDPRYHLRGGLQVAERGQLELRRPAPLASPRISA